MNPGDLGKETGRVVDGDLIARAVKASAQCGPHDFGMVEFGCSCSEEDPRAVIVDLVRVLEQFGERARLLSASTMGEAWDRLEELLAVEKENDSLGRTLEQAAAKNDELAKLVVEARGLLMRAREIAARDTKVHPLSPYVQGVEAWLEKEGMR